MGGTISGLAYFAARDVGTERHRRRRRAGLGLTIHEHAWVGPIGVCEVRASAPSAPLAGGRAGRRMAGMESGQEDARKEGGRGGTQEGETGEDRGDEDGDPEDPPEVEYGRHPGLRIAQDGT